MKARTPAQRHFLRTVAAAAAVAGGDAAEMSTATANAYELQLLRLAEHRRLLKGIQSIERKIEAKRAFLPEYGDWLAGILKADRGGQDDVLVTVMLWCIDVGDLGEAVTLADYAIRHSLTMPDNYKRSLPCVVAEEFADHALKVLGTEKPVDAAALLRALELTADADMPDAVRAKLHKAIGYALRDTEPAEALEHLKAALARHDKVGVKRDIELLERELRKPADPDQQNTPPADTGQG